MSKRKVFVERGEEATSWAEPTPFEYGLGQKRQYNRQRPEYGRVNPAPPTLYNYDVNCMTIERCANGWTVNILEHRYVFKTLEAVSDFLFGVFHPEEDE